MPVARRPLVHRLSVCLVPIRVRQPIQQARERKLGPAPYLIHPPADAIPPSNTAVHIHRSLRRSPRLTPKHVHISSNATIDALTPFRRPLARRARNSVRRADANAPFLTTRLPWARSRLLRGLLRIDSPLSAHLNRLLFPLIREPMLCDLLTLAALVALVYLLAERMTVFLDPV